MRLRTLCLISGGLLLGCSSDPTTAMPMAMGTSSGGPLPATSQAQPDSTGSDPTDASSGQVVEFCGNGVIDGEDVCDGVDVGDDTCATQGFDGGELACSLNCGEFDLSDCHDFECGDNTQEGSEQCDGGVDDATCETEGFDNGALSCTNSCQFDTSACGECGNEVIEGAEDCDINASLPESCNTLGFTTGVLGCDRNCLFDTSNCSVCGNDMIEQLEVCDGTDLAGQSCAILGFDSGTLTCVDCEFDSSGCGTCGNNLVDGDEICDNNNFDGETCQTRGFDNGTLSCSAGCDVIGEENCGICGNNIVDGDQEACDGAVLPGETCAALGFDSGTLVCSETCAFDVSACGTCGNSFVDGDEVCDLNSFGGETCATYGFDSGSLSCSAACDVTLTDNCGACGNGILDGAESCDGADFGGQTCASLGLEGGDLACSASCGYNYDGCDIQGVPFGNDGSYQGISLGGAILPCDDISATGTALGLGDDTVVPVNLGFDFTFYGTPFAAVNVSSNGSLNFTAPDPSFGNACLPAGFTHLIAAFWDDLNPGAAGEVRHQTLGAPGDQRFVVQWDVAFFSGDLADLIRVQVVLHETGVIDVCYPDTLSVADARNSGASATAGIQLDGVSSVEFSCNTPDLLDGLFLSYLPI